MIKVKAEPELPEGTLAQLFRCNDAAVTLTGEELVLETAPGGPSAAGSTMSISKRRGGLAPSTLPLVLTSHQPAAYPGTATLS
ncbi:hypothetical protein SKAU_G00149090 [Synaphobranchus kaupii]|uniref:Uncharacterized protein n=1 Tax=Synaphobranchus kaupii TaxID=118154 RepID=A0A9Q1J522_SYNKA|nr:hypothetical protein SKAU_G00149090 [Synaphobranchus kaupii]